ncbi:hypothetical protein K458DRAFT_350500 [Lentithecium fluviatile CBS 122367]|uniref:RRM domain-containing protein n=1 Tax=Lentithecium fluviatile CBS 122367 TaxID=1168545 RepID=A0A6G1IG97_9PLEO|nr:hypothetical protein K458DRAFT_350500 [Lentithecium fluviatile CBS 122367]
MAAENAKTKKRKGAPDAAPKPKKQKKTDETPAVGTRKSTRALKAAVEPIDSLAAKPKPARKRAEDYFSDDEAPAKPDTAKEKKQKKIRKAGVVADTADAPAVVVEVKEKPKKKAKKDKEPVVKAVVDVEAEAPKGKPQKGKKVKQSEEVQAPVVRAGVVVADEVPVISEGKKAKKTKKQEEAPLEEAAEAVEEPAGQDGDDLDDQTAALLAGFESEGDESDFEKDDEEIHEDAEPKLSKKQRKSLETIRRDSGPGVVYLGRIPHGFFEPQMKKYFSQFGDINRLRLSRNKKTGASKHYAFIEFKHGEVVPIVVQAMNNYLMFGHQLQCRAIPQEQVHEELFKGASERFKVDPRNKKAGVAMVRGAERATWEKRVEKENKRRDKKAKALKGEFDYDFGAPALKTVDAVPKKTLAVEDEAEQQLLTEAPATEVTETVQVTESKPDQLTVIETVKVKITKKAAKSKPEAEPDVSAGAEEQPVPVTKGKKETKRKSAVVAEPIEEPVAAPKAKKAKKDTKVAEGAIMPEKKRKTKAVDQDSAKPKKAKKAKA